jgi:hypothetical protein
MHAGLKTHVALQGMALGAVRLICKRVSRSSPPNTIAKSAAEEFRRSSDIDW